MIDRCYLEITNICNLSCKFCPKNGRAKRRMSLEEFDRLTDRLQGEIRFLYFHLMGEPMLHPLLPEFVRRAKAKGFTPILTTNGTLFSSPVAVPLLDAMPYKYQISLHSQEANGENDMSHYLDEVMHFAMAAAQRGAVVVLRLWNQGGYDRENEEILRRLSEYIAQPWTERYDGFKLAERIYLEYDKMFEWPDEEHTAYEVESFCYALRNQIGVLVDGSVVPCCLDHEGNMTLGNLHENALEEILQGERARNIYEGFSRHEAREPLCQRCGYAAATKRFRK